MKSDMKKSVEFTNDYYVISKDFKLVTFNQSVAQMYPGIKVGDYCFKATMKRETPCLHCPIAGNADTDTPIYYDPFYKQWIEAIFSRIDENTYAITCRPAEDRGYRVFNELGEENTETLAELISGHAANNMLTQMGKIIHDSDEKRKAQLKQIRELNKKLTERYSIIQSMNKIYFTSFYINMTDGTFYEIKTINNVQDTIGARGNAQEALNAFCEKLTLDEQKDEIRAFVDLSTINERMKDKDFLTLNYRGVTSGWSQLYFIAGDRADDGTLLTLFSATRTIHEEKAREEAQNKLLEEAKFQAEASDKAKSTFLFNMSHDIRTPMNAILGFTYLLEKHPDDPEKVLDYVKKINVSGEYLLTIINNVLDMARIESGKTAVDIDCWYIGNRDNTAVAVFDTLLQEKGITLDDHMDIIHPYIATDATKIKQIWVNLISNAIKYTPSGGKITLNMVETPTDIPGYSTYTTTLTDTGIGMSREYVKTIFEPFSREKNTTDSKVVGTGLGMAIVKKLIDLMEGTIEVESELGKGTTFTVTMTHKTIDDPYEYWEKQSRTAVEDANLTGKRILLAEDNELNAEIAKSILEDFEFEVEVASDGVICLDMVAKAPAGYYDAILMDIQMPNMNGYDATRNIRALADADKASVPIIAMTANAFEEDRRNAFAAGMNGHIAKPIDIAVLSRELAVVLK